MIRKRFLLLLIGAGALESRSVGQEILRIHDGVAFDALLRCSRIEDLDGDGFDEYLLGAPGTNGSRGRLFAMSGATGNELWRIDGNVSNSSLSVALADAGDFDGDGVHDIVAGAPGAGPGFARVYSGVSQVLLARSIGSEILDRYGQSVAGLGDVDGDGFDDVAIGGDATYARILGGPDGHLIRTHNGPPNGAAVSGLGDVDGDGVPDYLVGWHESSVNGTWTGTVRAYSGATGSVIYSVHGDDPYQGSEGFDGDHLGHSVTAIGDLDGDSAPDFVAGAPGGAGTLWATGPGFVRGYSGASGSVLFTHYGATDNSTLGMAVASGDDVNGDGVFDVLAGGPAESETFISQGAVYMFSGRTEATLWKILGEGDLWDLGAYIAILDDLDGDGYAEFAVGDPLASYAGYHSGRVTIYRGGPGDAVRFCAAAANSSGKPARLDIDGPISISYARMSLLASDAAPDQFGLFFYGGTEVDNPFGNGTICAGAPLFRLGPPQILDANGATSRAIDFIAPPVGSGAGQWIPGSTWILQFWYRDPQAGGGYFNLSDALRLTPTL